MGAYFFCASPGACLLSLPPRSGRARVDSERVGALTGTHRHVLARTRAAGQPPRHPFSAGPTSTTTVPDSLTHAMVSWMGRRCLRRIFGVCRRIPVAQADWIASLLREVCKSISAK